MMPIAVNNAAQQDRTAAQCITQVVGGLAQRVGAGRLGPARHDRHPGDLGALLRPAARRPGGDPALQLLNTFLRRPQLLLQRLHLSH